MPLAEGFLVEALGIAATAVSVASLMPQLVKSLRSRSTHDLSGGMWGLFCAGELLWFGYGLFAGSVWTCVATAITAATAAVILGLKLRYGDDAQRFVPITEELREVVRESEAASNRLLAAAEAVERLVGDLRRERPGPELAPTLDRLSAESVAIFEACNFQDISGQRIARVVKTFQYIEARNPRIREVWEKSQAERRGAGGAQATGPALAGEQGIDQGAIDRMFD
ncbi:MAG TPA: PQ-loop domain-containing transporter [Azospirillaceae bacterium]|nr:PQ-loop domain-containing transporter [Azospirillaceae bacterium]